MSATGNKHVVRMGPITVLSLVIVLSLATMSVLSFATAQAANRTTAKQEAATLALYGNEQQAQEFVAQIDAALQPCRQTETPSGEALAALSEQFPDIQVQGSTIQKSFTSDTRTLSVKLHVWDDLSYTIEGWQTTTDLDDEQAPTLWQGE